MIGRTNELGNELGIKYGLDLQIPLSKQTTFGETATTVGRYLGEFLIRGGKIDWWDTPGAMKDLLSDFKSATGEERNKIGEKIAEQFRLHPQWIKLFDYPGLGSGSEMESGEPGYVGDLMTIYNAVTQFESDMAWSDMAKGGQSVLDRMKTGRKSVSVEVKGKDAVEKAKGFWESVGDALNIDFNTPPEGERKPGLLESLRREKPLFEIGIPGKKRD
jgi:hypothetical protein